MGSENPPPHGRAFTMNAPLWGGGGLPPSRVTVLSMSSTNTCTTSQLKFQLGDVSAEPLDITVHIVSGHVVGMGVSTPAYPQKTRLRSKDLLAVKHLPIQTNTCSHTNATRDGNSKQTTHPPTHPNAQSPTHPPTDPFLEYI